MKPKVFSYAIGDVVLLKGRKTEDIVDDTSFDDGTMIYSLAAYGAWHDHDNLTLVRRADEESMDYVYKIQEDEYDEGED